MSAGLTIEPAGTLMGAVVTGVDFRRADATLGQRLSDALVAHQVLCIRDQDLTPHQFAAAARLFGEPQVQLLGDYRLSEPEEVTVISNYNKLAEGKPHVRATHWHTDDSYFARPAKATMLLAKALPSAGSGTEFINTHAVLDAMPPALRQRIEGRHAVHKYLSRRAKARVAVRTPDEEALTPDVSHPLIRVHPESNRPALYINPNRIDHVAGLTEAEGDALLDALYAFAFQPQFQHRHQWRPGDLVIWDNRCTMHRATTDFDITERREFHRVLLRGAVPR